MKTILIVICFCAVAFAQPSGGGVYPPPNKPACTATRTTNCSVTADSSGAVSVGTRVVGLAGADPTGVASSTAAISAAIAASKVVEIPPGSYKLSTVLTISTPVTLRVFSGVTITCAMSDPGTSSGCINITSDDVTISGAGNPRPVLTQGAEANIQTLIYIANRARVTVEGIKIDGNEGAQTNTGLTYTGIRSSGGGVGGGSHLTVRDCEITAAGHRAIDFRGTTDVRIENNYIHDTGVDIAGTAGVVCGNSVSVDVDGTTVSKRVWLTNNNVYRHGDSFAVAHAQDYHVIGNTIRGANDGGDTPCAVEAGIDVTGSTDGEVANNRVYNIGAQGLFVSIQSGDVVSSGPVTTHYGVQRTRFEGNLLISDSVLNAGIDAKVAAGDAGTEGAPIDQIFESNTFVGVRLLVNAGDGLHVRGNSFRNHTAAAPAQAITLTQSAYNVLKNFIVTDNLFVTTNETLNYGLSIAAGVTTPGVCVMMNNPVSGTGLTAYAHNSGTTVAINCIYDKIDSSGRVLSNLSKLHVKNTGGGVTAANYLEIEGSIADNSNYPGISLKGGTLATTYPRVALSNGGYAWQFQGGTSAGVPNAAFLNLDSAAGATLGLGTGNVGLKVNATMAITTCTATNDAALANSQCYQCLTANTTLDMRCKGSDATVRHVELTLAP